MTTTPSTLKRLFVGPDAKYAQTGVDEDILRVAGRSGDLIKATSDEDDGDSITLTGAVAIKGGGDFNVRAYGARGDGTTDDLAAINAAIVAANASTYGGQVYIPPGTYRISMTGLTGAIRPKSNVYLVGAGRGLTTLLIDDSGGGTDGLGNNINNGSTYDALDNFHVRGITFRGRADISRTGSPKAQLIRIKGRNLSFEDCEFIYSRNMGIVITQSQRVTIRKCRVFRTISDGIAVWDSSDVLISDNDITQANDDAISAHTNDSLPAPTRSGVTIVDNRITESQGIAVLGLKSVVISGNVLRRIMGSGMRVRAPGTDVQGQTPAFSCQIKNNIINDVFLRSEPNPRNAGQYYIVVSGGVRRANGGAVPPGEVDPATGTAVSLYGTNGTGTLYANETGSSGAPAPAGYAIDIVGNHLIRTLPSVTAVSQWGYDSSSAGLWVGDNGDGTGYYNGAISEAALSTNGVEIDPALWDSCISFNTIRTGGAYGIRFRATETVGNLDFAGLRIEGNKISNVSTSCIHGPTTTTKQRIWILNNELDGDPFQTHANRKTSGGRDGSWLVQANGPCGIYFQTTSGSLVEGNHFRNLADTLANAGSTNPGVVRNNYTYSEPSALGFSTSNKGVGTIYRTGINGQYLHIHEDCTPTSATYGQILSNPLVAASAIPSAGTYVVGHFVYNTAPAASGYLGWSRLTTGSAHVLNTDWKVVGAIV